MPGVVAQRCPISPLAGLPVPKEMVLDPAQLEREYYGRLVSFGGHRGFSARPSGTENIFKIYTKSFRCESHWKISSMRPGKSLIVLSIPEETSYGEY